MKITTGIILTELIEEKGVSRYKVAKDLCLDPKTVRNYCDDLSTPDLYRAKLLADYFGVTIDYLAEYDTDECEISIGYDIDNLIYDLTTYRQQGMTTAMVECGKLVVLGNISNSQEDIRKIKVM